MTTNILEEIEIPAALHLDIAELPRGIDNYHIDVKLSDTFCVDLKNLAANLIQEKGSIKPESSNYDTLSNALQRSYADMMTALIHRVKTDLKADDINFLQFSVPSYVLKTVKSSLDKYINTKKKVSLELRNNQSSSVLGAQEHINWLKKNYISILYAVNKITFGILRRAEERSLRPVRKQYLGSFTDFTELLFNPMLMNRDINSPRFLIEQYQFWGGRGAENNFSSLNKEFENLLEVAFSNLEMLPLQTDNQSSSTEPEIFDEYGGLLLSKKFLGPATDSKNLIQESFCWLDSYKNIQHLFDIEKLQDNLIHIRKEHGFKAWWASRAQVKKLKKVHTQIKKIINKKRLLKQFVASHKTRSLFTKEFGIQVEARILYQYLCGEITDAKLQNKIYSGKAFTEAELEPLRELANEVIKETKTETDAYITKTLINISRYRLHLKHLRFAHRAFNRISVLQQREEIRLSKQADTLFELPCTDEIDIKDDKIVHHTILKADVRGSTTVTEELEKKKLNPASYFSLRFFNPINKVLATFSANKVFIEGDAIILSFLEHECDPQQWLSVARSCGLAKAMLSIIHDNNKHSKEMGLPPLEIGIGICYSNDSPRFLYDEDTPIMISSAIGLADRMSSCSWRLRALMNADLFNVEVLKIGEDEKESGEKGQRYVRYNVNGILLADEAFEKLQNEIELKRTTVNVNDGQEIILYYGQYKDLENQTRTLVVRQGKIDLWKNDEIVRNVAGESFYYEVVTNTKIISLIRA